MEMHLGTLFRRGLEHAIRRPLAHDALAKVIVSGHSSTMRADRRNNRRLHRAHAGVVAHRVGALADARIVRVAASAGCDEARISDSRARNILDREAG